MNKTLLYIWFLIAGCPLFGQSLIKGKISGINGELLAGASIVLKNSDQKILSYAISDDAGAYSLEIKQKGAYVLEVSYLGYEKENVEISISGETGTIRKSFSLREGEAMLKEIVLEAEQPVKRRGDTLVYDAKALSNGHEAVVEDLLRNIPGITILENGKIKYGDNEVEKVMVDGDDLFNKGYSLLTKNMPIQPLDKIEVLRNYSKNRLLKGVEDSNSVALNLTVDEKFKNIWFGNLTAGYGNDDRHKATGNLMNFGKKFKNFLNFSLNNAGYDYVGDIAGMQYNSSDTETIGSISRAAQSMQLQNKVSNIDESRSRFNNAKTISLSSILPLSTKTKIRISGFLGFDDLRTYQDLFIVRDFQDVYFENRETNNSALSSKKSYISALLTSDISSNNMLQSLTTYNNGKIDFNNDFSFNGLNTDEYLQTKNTYFDQQITYTHKWKDKNVVLLKSRFLTDRLPQQYNINDYLLGDLFDYQNINAIGNNVRSFKEYGGIEADFKLKQKKGDLISFIVGFENNSDRLASRFSLFTDSERIVPDNFQSDASYTIGDLYAKSGYIWKIRKFSVATNFSAHQLFNSFKNQTDTSRKQTPFFLNAAVNAKWELSPDNAIYGSYMYSIANSNILEVNDAYLLVSSRGFSKGLGHFNQLESSVLSLSYNNRHYLNRYNFSIGTSYARQNDVLSYRSQIEQNSSLSEAFVMRGGDRIGLNLNSHLVVRFLKGSIGFQANAYRTMYYNEVNGSGLRKNILINQFYSLSWRSSFKSDFNFNLGTEWNFSKVKSDYSFTNATKVSYLELLYSLTDRLAIKVKSDHYNFGGVDRYNNYLFTDTEVSYTFKKDKYAVFLDGRNLFNTKSFTTYNISDIGYSENSFRLLPRYVMLSFRFRF